MSSTARLAFAAVVLLSATACTAGRIVDSESAYQTPKQAELPDAATMTGEYIALHVWSQDASLRALAAAAAERIRVASGIVIAVAPEPLVAESRELRWSGDFVSHQAARYVWDGQGSGELLLGIDTPSTGRVGYVVHEMMHALGADHVDNPAQPGVMSPGSNGDLPITTGDLESLCAAADCAWMTPEA